MEQQQGGIDGSKSVRDMHHLRLMSLLQEQVRDHGRKRAAEVLGVDRRTLDTALDQGMLTRRIRGALGTGSPVGGGFSSRPAAGPQRQAGGQAGGPGGRSWRSRARRYAPDAGPPRTKSGRLREEQVQGFRKLDRALAGREKATGGDSEEEAKASGVHPGRQANLKREYPELVTLDPADDDEDGIRRRLGRWCKEWRELKRDSSQRTERAWTGC